MENSKLEVVKRTKYEISQYQRHIISLGNKAAVKMTEHFGTEESLKIDVVDTEVKKEFNEVTDRLNELREKGVKELSEKELTELIKLIQKQTILEIAIEEEDGQIVRSLSFNVKDINGKNVPIKMKPAKVEATDNDYSNYTLHKFKLPENCYIYMKGMNSLDFLKTIEIVEEF